MFPSWAGGGDKEELPHTHFSHWVPPAGPTELPPANPVLSLPGAPSTGRPFLRRKASVSAISPSVRMHLIHFSRSWISLSEQRGNFGVHTQEPFKTVFN